MNRPFLPVLALLLAAGAAGAATPGWRAIKPPPSPTIGWNGAAGSMVLRCQDRPRQVYNLAIVARANGLKPGNWVAARVEGGRKVKVHVKVTIDTKGWATLTAYSRLSGYPDEHPDAFDIASAFFTARKPVIVTAGPLRMVIPIDGIAAAQGPMIKTCGDPAKLARKVRQRSEPA